MRRLRTIGSPFSNAGIGQLEKQIHGKAEYRSVAELLGRSVAKLALPGTDLHKTRLQALSDLERRRGKSLPQSYRHFASLTGGYWVATIDIDAVAFDSNLLPVEKVGAFSEVDRLSWGAWQRAMDGQHLGPNSLPANEYYVYDNNQDFFRWEYLPTLLKVGELNQGAVLLLNPHEVTSDGEWEAWLLSTQVGAHRYRSFAELMQTIAFQEIMNAGGRHIPSEKLNVTCARHLKTIANRGT